MKVNCNFYQFQYFVQLLVIKRVGKYGLLY